MKTIQDLHESAVRVSRSYRSSERELVSILGELDERRGYRDLGYSSLHAYATKALKLSDDVAYILIRLARASRAVPELKAKLEAEAITLSNARLIAPVLKPENSGIWLAKAETLSKRELEKELVREFPEKAVKEKAKPVGANRMRIEVGVSDELHGKLARAKDLLSQKHRRPVSLEEVLEILSEDFLERNDPLRKAARAQGAGKPATAALAGRNEISEVPVQGLAPGRQGGGKRRRIPAAVRHAVQLRDEGRCTGREVFGTAGNRCENRRFLHYHHIRPVSAGGEDTSENIELRCSDCHALEHWNEAAMHLPSANPGMRWGRRAGPSKSPARPDLPRSAKGPRQELLTPRTTTCDPRPACGRTPHRTGKNFLPVSRR